VKDALDRNIGVGDRIAFSSRNSNVAELALARVLEVGDEHVRVQREKPIFPWKEALPRPGVLRHSERIVIVERGTT
jgi:hypothetical protein